MSWILFALLAPFMWGLTNHLDKFIIDRRVNGMANYIFFSSFGTVILLILVLIFKGLSPLPAFSIVLAMCLGIASNIGLLFYAKAMQKDDASTVVPLFQFIPVFVLIMGFVFLGEFLSNKVLLGFVLVFFGGWLVSIEAKLNKVFKLRRGFWFMILSSIFYSIGFVIARSLFSKFSFFEVYPYDLFGFLIPSILLLLHPKSRVKIFSALKSAKKSTFALFLTNDLIDITGNIFFRLAVSLAPAALVSVVLGVQPFFVLGVGLFLTLFFPKIIKESISKPILIKKLIGISIIFVGILLISL